MKIDELFKQKKFTFSFEIFPPKKDSTLDDAKTLSKSLSELNPDFISVTYGASGSTNKKTAEISTYIQNELNVPALSHLTCVDSTKDEMSNYLDNLKTNNVKNILALRGDKPADFDDTKDRDFHYASDLIKLLAEKKDFSIAAACYPEGHVEQVDRERDLAYLKQKVDLGASFLISQLCFSNQAMYRFLYRAFSHDIKVPIIAGIMPITSVKQLERIFTLCGTTPPSKLRAMIERFGDNDEAVKQAGIAYATEQIIDLIANGISGIHLYTMNKPEIAKIIMNNISSVLEAVR